MHPLTSKVESAIEKIRPYLQADGGNIELVDITKDNVARIRLMGACSSCSMSVMTMKAGVEETIKKEVPEIKAVLAVNDHAEMMS